MGKKKTKDKGELSDSKKYPASYYKSKKLFIALIVIGSIAITLAAVFVYDYFNQNNIYTLSYTCEGVDSDWLEDHPFDTSSFPTELKRKDSLILHSPHIDNYTFVEWKITWDDSSFTFSSSSTFKDGEAYKVSNRYFVPLFNNKALVIAKYAKE